MPEIKSFETGRTFRLRLHPGEPVCETLGSIAMELGIPWASVAIHGHLQEGRLTLGRRLYSRAHDDPDRVSFDDGRLVIGQGEVWSGADGRHDVALRCTVGLQKEVFVADLVEGVVGEGLSAVLLEARTPTSGS